MKRNKRNRNRHSKPYMQRKEDMKRMLKDADVPFPGTRESKENKPDGMSNSFEVIIAMLLIGFLLSRPFPFRKESPTTRSGSEDKKRALRKGGSDCRKGVTALSEYLQ